MTRLPSMVMHVLNAAGGGAALSTIGLIDGLRDRGVSSSAICHVAGSTDEIARLRDAVDGRLEVRPLYWWNTKNRAKQWRRPLIEGKQLVWTQGVFGSTRDVIAAARRFDADLIHTNTILTPEGGLAASWLGVPHVWHLRERVGPGCPFRFPVEGKRLGRLIERMSSRVIANSPNTASIVSDWFSPGHVQVVDNAIDVERFAHIRERKSSGTIRVGMIANLTSTVKRHDIFIDIAKRFRDEPVEFHLFGHAPPEGQNEYVDAIHAAAAEQPNRLFVRGFLPPEEIVKELDILLHPTGKESFGRIIVEAMAGGLPVVGVNSGGVGDIVRHHETGLLADSETAAGLAPLVRTLIDDAPMRRRMGKAGRMRAQAHYSSDTLLNSMCDVYAREMNHPVRRRR